MPKIKQIQLLESSSSSISTVFFVILWCLWCLWRNYLCGVSARGVCGVGINRRFVALRLALQLVSLVLPVLLVLPVGFEFDYIGVIIGPDLRYDTEQQCLITDIKEIKDPMLKRNAAYFDNYARNIYRVLMSRGMKGCYVYCCDENLKEYLRAKLEIENKKVWYWLELVSNRFQTK